MITKKDFANIESDHLFVEFIEVREGEDVSNDYQPWQDCKIKLRIDNHSFSVRYVISKYADLYIIPDRDQSKTVSTLEREGQVHEYEKIEWKEDELISNRVLHNINPVLAEKLEELGSVILTEWQCSELFGEFYEIDYPYFYVIERRLSFQEIEDAFDL